MKIVRLTTLLDYGGQERKYISFTQDASMLNHEYYFAAIGHGGHAATTLQEKGFNVTIFNQNVHITNLKNIWILYQWFKKIQPDVVHTAAAEANFHGIIAARLAGVKVRIAEEIGFPSHSKKAQIIFRWVYKNCNKVICVSRAVKEFLIKIGEINSAKGTVIYNPVSTKKKFERTLSGEFTVVCVGRLEKVKNQQLLIKAFSQLENKESKLILVGDGRERTNLEQLCVQLNCTEQIEFIGFSAEPEKYLAKAHLFVLPSLSEGFGIAVLEAMQQGLPCLCSNVGGIPEFLEENKTGWLFNPTAESELVQKLSVLSKLPKNELEEMGKNAQTFIANRFSEKEYVTNLEQLYQQLHD
jgi:glycosyltransferase involved in cell wall biosynthesis